MYKRQFRGIAPGEEKEWHKVIHIEGTLNYLHQVSDKTKDYASSSQGTGSGDIFLTAETINGFAYVDISFQQGGGIDQDIPTLNGLNNDVTNGAHLFTRPDGSTADANQAEPFIARFYYQGHSADEKFSITVGKFCVNDFFDNNEIANSQITQFYSAALVNSAAFSYGQDESGYTHGIALTYKFRDNIEFKAAGVSANGTWDNVFKRNLLWYIGELDLAAELFGKKGNYRLYYYHDGSPHTKYSDPARTTESSTGFGVSFDQGLTDDITAFIRYSSHDGSVTTAYYDDVDESFSFGGQVSGGVWGRGDDIFGLAASFARLSSDHKNDVKSSSPVDSGLGTIANPGDETLIEAYYNYSINQHVLISADYQYIANPGADADKAVINVFGARLHVEF